MAKLFIREYVDMPQQTGVLLQIGNEPAVVNQTPVAVGAEAKSAAFNTKTRFVRLHTDAICSVAFGTVPTATTDDARMAANQTEFFGVRGGDKVSVIANT